MIEDPDCTLTTTYSDGTTHKTKITPEQAFDLSAGKAIAYFPRDERVLVDDEGQITHHDDARPQYPEAA